MSDEIITIHTPLKTGSTEKRTFKVERKVAEMSLTVKGILQDLEGTTEIDINVDSDIYEEILNWSTHRAVCPMIPIHPTEEYRSDNIEEWDKQFLQKIMGDPLPNGNPNVGPLFHYAAATNYLDIDSLLRIFCKTIANIVKENDDSKIVPIFTIPGSASQA